MPILQIGQGALSIFTFGLSAKHKKAVARENNVLGAAQPAFEEAVDRAVNNFSAGMLDAAQAKRKIDDALDEFKTRTAPIRKMEGQAGETGDPWAGGKCNAACVILHQYTRKAEDIKKQIDAASAEQPGASGVPAERRSASRPSGRGEPPPKASPFLQSVLPGLSSANRAMIVVFSLLAAVTLIGFAVVRGMK